MSGKYPTLRMQIFVKEYLIDLNATAAAGRAGYQGRLKQVGWQLLKEPWVRQEIQKAMDERAKRLEITADKVLQELAAIAFCDTRKFFDKDGNLIPLVELDDVTAPALAGMDVSTRKSGTAEEPEFETIRKIKLWDKIAALEKLGKHLKLFGDNKLELTGAGGAPIIIADFTGKADMVALAASLNVDSDD